MMTDSFQALVLDQQDGKTVARIGQLSTDSLPAGDVLIDVAWSSLNYKDGLAITGAGKIVRTFPFIPGIDFAGRVAASENPDYRTGEEVILTGWGVGERHWGGLAQKARVKGDWLVPLPAGLNAQRAMAIGTAGFTAMLAVQALEQQGVRPGDGEVVVTGASGGLGSVAIPLLAKAGYRIVASSGRAEMDDYLTQLGASEIVHRKAFSEGSSAPLDSARWAGAIDTVGGDTLVNLLKAMRYHGVVAVCGLAGSPSLNGTVYPFILRGVRLIGIDSVMCPKAERLAAWNRLASDLDPSLLDRVTSTIGLSEVPQAAPLFLDGKVRGRLVVDVSR
jgi:acrylyl-CoA reductase (NADPH)